jgi:hypothetical protein
MSVGLPFSSRETGWRQCLHLPSPAARHERHDRARCICLHTQLVAPYCSFFRPLPEAHHPRLKSVHTGAASLSKQINRPFEPALLVGRLQHFDALTRARHDPDTYLQAVGAPEPNQPLTVTTMLRPATRDEEKSVPEAVFGHRHALKPTVVVRYSENISGLSNGAWACARNG